MLISFNGLRKSASLTFEGFVRKILTAQLRGSGRVLPDAELRSVVVEG